MKPGQHIQRSLALIPVLLLVWYVFGFGQSALAQPNLTNGWSAYYSFNDGTATDNSGNGLNGTIVGGVSVTNWGGSKALVFDGISGYVNFGSFANLIPEATVSALVQVPAGIGAGGSIVDRWSNGENLALGINAARRFTAAFHERGVIDPTFQYPEISVESSTVAAEGQVYQVALTYAGHWLRLFVNGVQEAEQYADPAGGNHASSSSPNFIVGWDPRGGRFFKGTIDEVRLFNRALSTNEIRSLILGITSQPQNAFVLPGGVATFSVGALSFRAINYQWRRDATNLSNGGNISGVTTPNLVVSNVQPSDVGVYSVLIWDGSSSSVSSNAFLTIAIPGVDDDGDGLLNTDEVLFGTNPLNPDTDGDGLADYAELFLYGTNPLQADTDGDGIPDAWEVQHGLNSRFSDAADDFEGDGLSNLAEYNWSLSHPAQLVDPRTKYSISPTASDFAFVTGAGTNQFSYDRNNRLIGAEFDRGLALAYMYDGNDNLVRQVSMRHDGNTNGLPDVWEFLTGLTNNASAYTDSDGDGWTDWQEWKAGTNPRSATSTPNLLGNPGTQIASLQLPFTPSNFVAGVGQLDSLGAEEIVLGADGNPGGTTNFLLVLTQGVTTWQTQRVDVGPFGITSIAVGQPTNRPSAGIYVGLRGATNGSGRVMEFMRNGGLWQSNIVALSTNQAAFVLGVRGSDVLISLATTNVPDGSLSAASFATNWNLSLVDTNASHRGLGATVRLNANGTGSGRILDAGTIQIRGNATDITGVNRTNTDSWYALTSPGLTWTSAQDVAKSYGGNLVTIEDSSENQWVCAQFPEDIWIGLYRLPGSTHNDPNSWKWVSGSVASIRFWNSGEPNNATGEEYYADFRDGGSSWNDSPSYYVKRGLVEFQKPTAIIPEPGATRTNNWRGHSLASGLFRGTNGNSFFYTFADDKNANGRIDFGDDFVTAEYLVGGTNASLLTLSRKPIAALSPAQSYGLASVNFLNGSNEVFFTGEPDGQVFLWTATGTTNPLQRQLFSGQHTGKAWHALAGVKTVEPGEGLIGLRVDPVSPTKCDLILWAPQSQLPQLISLPNTAPAAAALPSATPLGSLASVSVRLWDTEGNASTTFLQFQVSGSTNWTNATLATLDGGVYSTSTRVAASPGGVNHTVVWNALANVGPGLTTNILLRARAADLSLLGDWSVATPFTLNTAADSDGDGIPDTWENQFFGGTSRNGTGDFDGDGFNDFAEYVADTNPTNALSFLHFTSIQPVPGGVWLQWAGGTNATQNLQRAFSLGSSFAWTNLLTIPPPTPISGSYTDSFGPNPPQFYRIEAVQP